MIYEVKRKKVFEILWQFLGIICCLVLYYFLGQDAPQIVFIIYMTGITFLSLMTFMKIGYVIYTARKTTAFAEMFRHDGFIQDSDKYYYFVKAYDEGRIEILMNYDYIHISRNGRSYSCDTFKMHQFPKMYASFLDEITTPKT